MASLVLSQVAISALAPSIYGSIASGASIASSSFLWSAAQGIAGAAGTIAGTIIDRMLFSQGEDFQGPRLSDLTVQTSTEGATLPILFGTMRFAGNIIWSTGLTENATEEEQGGMSGGGSSYTTYSYTTDAAVAICEGVITGIRRIWADSKLIYDVSETASVDTLVSSSSIAKSIRIYTGTEDQLEDPLIQAVEGSAPAYRGTAYIVVEDLNLADFGNRLPNFTFEVVKSGTLSESLYYFTPITDGNSYHTRATFNDSSGTHIFLTAGYTWMHWVSQYGATRLVESKTTTINYPLPSYDAEINSYSDEPGLFSKRSFSTSTVYYVGYVNGGFSEITLDAPNIVYPDGGAKEGSNYLVTGRTGSGYLAAALNGVALSLPSLYGVSDKGICGFTPNYIFIGHSASNSILRLSKAGVYIDTITVPVGTVLRFVSDTVAYLHNLVAGLESLYRVDFTDPLSIVSTLISSSTLYWSMASPSNSRVTIFENANSSLSLYYGNYAEDDKLWILFPNMDTITKDTQTLQQVCEQIVAKSELLSTKYDFSALSSDTVRGYVISKVSDIRSALEPLIATYSFDLIEENDKIIAIKSGSTAIVDNLDKNELGTYIL